MSALRYQHNPATDLPHLVDDAGRLRPDERAAWEAVLSGRCSAQTLRDGERVAFPPVAAELPTEYWVRKQPGGTARVPTFLLDPVAPGPAAAAAPADWAAGFVAAATRLAHTTPTDRVGRHGLEFVLDELREAARDRPDDLLAVLVGAFAAVGRAAAEGDPADRRREQFYDCALAALDPRLRAVGAARGGRLTALVGAVARVVGWEPRAG